MSGESESIFRKSDRPDVALITNHGYAGVEIPIGGAPDTGGQIVYVNSMALALDALGYRVTVFSRGGFPHFGGNKIRREPEYLSDFARYVFVPGGGDTFIRKEDIAVALDEEIDWLDTFIRQEAAHCDRAPWAMYEFVNTHYWDAAVIGARLVARWRNDVAAEALVELLTGAVPPDVLKRLQEDRHWRHLGASPAFHLGSVLLEQAGSPALPVLERVRLAGSRWADASWHAREHHAGEMIAAVEEAVAGKDEVAPSINHLAAAQALGTAILATCPARSEQLNAALAAVDRHVWTPHSLSVLKEENFRDRPLDVRRDLKFCERRNHEQLVSGQTVAFAATSGEIAERLRTHYGVPAEQMYYFPPCVDRGIFRRYSDKEMAATYRYLAGVSGLPVDRLRAGRIVFETSRMDQTKRKDLLLDAFVPVAKEIEDTFLFIGGGPENDLLASLTARRDAEPALRGRAFLTGFIPEEHIAPLFSIAAIYVSASEMEGFGMSVSQAAAAGAAVVSSDLIPFSTQYVPDDALIVAAGDVDGFAGAILRLLKDDADRAARANRLVEKVKVLDWNSQTTAFIRFLRGRGIAVAEGRPQP